MWPFGNQSTSVLYLVVDRVDGDSVVADQHFVRLGMRKRRILNCQRRASRVEEGCFILHV